MEAQGASLQLPAGLAGGGAVKVVSWGSPPVPPPPGGALQTSAVGIELDAPLTGLPEDDPVVIELHRVSGRRVSASPAAGGSWLFGNPNAPTSFTEDTCAAAGTRRRPGE